MSESEYILEEKSSRRSGLYCICNSVQRVSMTIKRNAEYVWPFINTIPAYLIEKVPTQSYRMLNYLLQYIDPSREPKISYHERQPWSTEKPYTLVFKPNRDPIRIHNMVVKFNPIDPHLLNHKEVDFMKCITPAEQAASYKGELFFLDTSAIAGTSMHNPSIVEYQEKMYMTLRVDLPHLIAETFLTEVTKEFHIASYYSLIKDNSRSHEDARLVTFKDKIYASYVTDTSYKFGYYRTCMEINNFVPGEQIDDPLRPNIDDNIHKDGFQKNWLFFERKERFLVITQIDPLEVYDATDDLNNPVEIVKKAKVINDWPFGQIRCSTIPILIEEENKYLSFFHSHLVTTDNIREYFVGALLFDDEFNITHYSKVPLFMGTPHIKRFIRANTILPYGCIRQGDNLVLSVGINDKAAAIMKLPVKRIIAELAPKED